MEDKKWLYEFIDAYESYLRSSFEELWGKVDIEADKLEAYSVIGGLLSRQVTMSIEMARSPNIWNGHSAPLFLRSMTDLYIAISWMMMDLENRTRKYILHGLGEAKLLLEHYENNLEERPDDPYKDEIELVIEAKRNWIEFQRRESLVEVNLGNWSHLDYRKMSQEADCEGLYKFPYKEFSHAVHNMWPHVSIYNCRSCENPLHRHHLIPELRPATLDMDFLYRSCKYVDMVYELFIERFGLQFDSLCPLDWWHEYFESHGVDE